jgi:hypothetical protein
MSFMDGAIDKSMDPLALGFRDRPSCWAAAAKYSNPHYIRPHLSSSATSFFVFLLIFSSPTLLPSPSLHTQQTQLELNQEQLESEAVLDCQLAV